MTSQMGGLFSSCCCSCKILNNNHNSVGILPEQHLKILLLGPTGSGKTEVAHMLTKIERTDFEATNGSKFYQTEITTENGENQSIGITEIGGSIEMQRIWHHYFASTMGIIYCYDMSSSYEHLLATFQLLDQVLSHSFIRGKSILLIGTKSDLVDEGLQLYDIENTFQLDAMANKYESKLRMCYVGKDIEENLKQDLLWLIKSIKTDYEALKVRIKGDTNMKAWNEQTQTLIAAGRMKRWSYRRFPNKKSRKHRHKVFWKYASGRYIQPFVRPRTAPAVYTISNSSRDNTISWQNSADTVDTTNTVPNDTQNTDDENNEDLILATTSERVTAI